LWISLCACASDFSPSKLEQGRSISKQTIAANGKWCKKEPKVKKGKYYDIWYLFIALPTRFVNWDSCNPSY
jgi:hypothetical protein